MVWYKKEEYRSALSLAILQRTLLRRNHMAYFSIKTKDSAIVERVLSRNGSIEFSGINVLQEELIQNSLVFIVLGGDRPSWDTGLIGIGVVSQEPYDIGYQGRNYRVRLDVKLLLPHPIKREDLVPYRETYGTIGIGPITKWEPNQALSQVAERNAIALMRAMIELYPEVYEEMHALIGDTLFNEVLGPTVKMHPYSAVYGENTNTAVENSLRASAEEAEDAESEHEYIAENILLYGVPGCGKSYTIKTEYRADDAHMERAVFHPDYSYSDFIGQILPKTDGHHIEYRFEPGPFTKILRNAIANPAEAYYLVVEEINRGNAPAIFGDVFQLLDRDQHGRSEYGISNESIAAYVYQDADRKIRIPGNLFVIATMNTSDQNVFTLDTAFKRRWTMRMIRNDIDACEYADHQICAWGITWGSFAKAINQKITELSENSLSNEDARIGAYFVRESDLDDAERFGEKVLMYLWNDALKFDHDKVFRAEYRTLDELIDGFVRVGFDVFLDDIVFETQGSDTEGIPESAVPTAEQYLEKQRNPELVEAYRSLFHAVVQAIPNAFDSSVGSLSYAAWKTNDIRKASFADVVFRRSQILIMTETPRDESLLAIGEQLPVDNHHNHYFQIRFNAEHSEQVVRVLVDAYEQLKSQ